MFTVEVETFDLSKLDCVSRFVTDDDNVLLTVVAEEEEVKEVVFQMNSASAAGLDGFFGDFYKSCWDIVRDDVVSMVWSYFLVREFIRFITHTSIVLLPKKLNPKTFVDYRPISLCNFSSKIVTKNHGGQVVLCYSYVAFSPPEWFCGRVFLHWQRLACI